jgi:hypothetical protein
MARYDFNSIQIPRENEDPKDVDDGKNTQAPDMIKTGMVLGYELLRVACPSSLELTD